VSELWEEAVPIASAAAWSPTAGPAQRVPLLTLDGPEGIVATVDETAPAPAPAGRPRVDRLGALRDIARRLRTAPDSEETLQLIVDSACECTGADAGMLSITQPEHRQVVAGTALGAGPYIAVQLRAGGPTFGELVLTRMSDAEEFSPEEETFAGLVAEYIAKAVSGLRRGTVLSTEQQDFIDRVTEEMRAPLASAANVLGVVLGGESGALGDELRSYLVAVARDQRRMLRMVDDLLAAAHLRPPEVRELESIPVGPWLRRAVDAVAEDAAERSIEVGLTPPAEPWLVKGVPAQLDRVIAQLLDNALKFSEPGSRVAVSAGEAEGMLRIAVEDTGMGFDGADSSRMLECFARAINAEAARIPGAGVGLFVVAEIVKNHQGRVWLESRRDEGTQAYVALPFAA